MQLIVIVATLKDKKSRSIVISSRFVKEVNTENP